MNRTRNLPKRSEISNEHKWRLEDIYRSDQEWEQDFHKVKNLIEQVQTKQGTLSQSGKHLLETLTLQDELASLLDRICSYAKMRRDEDNGNATYQALMERASAIKTQACRAISYIQPEILSIPASDLALLQKSEAGLAGYRFFLEEIIRLKAHTLSAKEEAILAQVSAISQAPSSIFAMLHNADIRFPPIKNEQGEAIEVTMGRYIQFMECRDRRVRRDAYEALHSTIGLYRNTIAATLASSIKRDVFYARVRKFDSALQSSLFADNIDPSVYDNLVATIREHLPLMHRYVSLRKRLLGLDELHMYDMYVPMVKEVQLGIPYDEAVSIIKESLQPLGSDYAQVLHEGFSSGWIDVYENQGKTSGAYCGGCYATHPYVLMNYQDNLNSMFTLAHEMGHALHKYYSNKNQPYRYANYRIFVAEVASTVNEALLMQYLLDKTTEKDKRIYLLNYYLEQFRGTMFRQTMFAEFEKIIHAKAEAGEALTADTLSDIYRKLLAEYHGEELVMDSGVDLEWARIPHFYNNFYVYKYATGFSAATSLSKQILEEGQSAVDRYMAFLKSGSSDYPLNLLRKAGVDLNTEQPIIDALRVFESLLREMEELAVSQC